VKVSGKHGRLRLRLEPVEVQLLESLFDQLEAVLAEDDAERLAEDFRADLEASPGAAAAGRDTAVDPVRRRLSPPAFPDDAGAEAEFRRLTGTALRELRDERIAACRADLARGGEVELRDDGSSRRWIQVLNDLRLALGTRLGVTEDIDEADIAEQDAPQWAVYYWLTATQDAVVAELLR
jgi:hypothetical protein